MKYSELQAALQNATNTDVTIAKIGEVLGVTRQTMHNKIKEVKKDVLQEEITQLENYFDVTLNEKIIYIDYYPYVFGSCGSGTFVLSEQKEVMQVPVNLISSYSKIKKYSVINARGDSMQPFINDMDKLIVEHYQGEQITDNHIYVFCYNDEIFIKRLSKNVDEIIIKSDNPDSAYRTRIIEKENINNIFIIGEIVGLIRDMRR